MDWDFIMDTAIATLCASLISISGMLIMNWLSNRKGYKDIDAKMGTTPDKKTLSQQHADIQKDILQKSKENQNELVSKIGELPNTTLSGQNISIITEIRALQNYFNDIHKAEETKRQQLTSDQTQIEQSIAILNAFSSLMAEIQFKNSKLIQENQNLQLENRELKHLLELLEQEEDMTEDQEMKLL